MTILGYSNLKKRKTTSTDLCEILRQKEFVAKFSKCSFWFTFKTLPGHTCILRIDIIMDHQGYNRRFSRGFLRLAFTSYPAEEKVLVVFQIYSEASKKGLVVFLMQHGRSKNSKGRRDMGYCQNVEDGKHTEFSVDDDGVVWFEDRLCVPNDQGTSREGYGRKAQDVLRLYPNYDLSQVKKLTSEGLVVCYSVVDPMWKWMRFSMDFDYWFAYYSEKIDSDLGVVDRATKSAHFLPIRKTMRSKVYVSFLRRINRKLRNSLGRYVEAWLGWTGFADEIFVLGEFCLTISRWHAASRQQPFEAVVGYENVEHSIKLKEARCDRRVYADNTRRDLEFQVRDPIFQRVGALQLPKPYKPKISFPQRLRKEKIEAQYGKFLDMIRAVRINVPLIDVLARMPNYGKFLKELISNKHKIEQISAAFFSDESSAMIQNKVPPKLEDPRSFLIPCNFNKTFSYNALADLGASINLMPYSLYAKLSLETLKHTRMSVRLADRSFQYPIRIAENMLIVVGKFTFPADFVILKMEEDNKVPLILGRPFLHSTDTVIRVKQKQPNLGVGTERMIFNIDSAIKHSYSNDDTCFNIDVIDEILEEDFDALLDKGSKILHSIEGILLEEEIF
ncbi:reverse transcriptase domain-containing protein [Tanacetum coccineum]|uniref:Reverse transcriptase domain-containing protein n=1 Tax=Tanacetum coccineum TaxID=301880 RepID=A0ABQ4X0M0_9ASTR